MTYLRSQLPPAITWLVLAVLFGYLQWICPPPWADIAALLNTVLCVQWARARFERIGR